MRNLIKKILKESELDWIDEIQSNPFGLDLSVIFLDKKLTEEEAEYIMDLIDASDVHYYQSREVVIDGLVTYSPGGYIKSYINKNNIKRIGYGDTMRLFDEYKWASVLDSLKDSRYVEFNVTDILPKI